MTSSTILILMVAVLSQVTSGKFQVITGKFLDNDTLWLLSRNDFKPAHCFFFRLSDGSVVNTYSIDGWGLIAFGSNENLIAHQKNSLILRSNRILAPPETFMQISRKLTQRKGVDGIIYVYKNIIYERVAWDVSAHRKHYINVWLVDDDSMIRLKSTEVMRPWPIPLRFPVRSVFNISPEYHVSIEPQHERCSENIFRDCFDVRIVGVYSFSEFDCLRFYGQYLSALQGDNYINILSKVDGQLQVHKLSVNTSGEIVAKDNIFSFSINGDSIISVQYKLCQDSIMQIQDSTMQMKSQGQMKSQEGYLTEINFIPFASNNLKDTITALTYRSGTGHVIVTDDCMKIVAIDEPKILVYSRDDNAATFGVRPDIYEITGIVNN